MKCEACRSDISFDCLLCSTCGQFIGYPNVREVSGVKETEALARRYDKMIRKSQEDCRDVQLADFENLIKSACAVVAVDLDTLSGFMSRDSMLYSTYSLQVSGEVRKAASVVDDKKVSV